ncbi:MAG: DUF1318 domain-containing protein [Candidatus Hydrogenedentes bacterium]|nr:DUF1318 domain-containing protein [Candidatus Hydrogenedentota bacterium]
MKTFAITGTLALALIVAGCVLRTEHTINAHVTLDIRHIEDQADNVLDYVEGKSDAIPGMPAAPAPAAADGSTSWLRHAVDFLSPIQVAYAAELQESSPLITQIATKMRGRFDALEALRRDACLGENNRGYVELRDCAAFSDAQKKNEAQQLLSEENKDRKALYAEVARLNADQGITVSTVENIYAGKRILRGKSGEVYQLPPAGEYFDAVKDSAVCKSLGAECKPNAWVTLK